MPKLIEEIEGDRLMIKIDNVNRFYLDQINQYFNRLIKDFWKTM